MLSNFETDPSFLKLSTLSGLDHGLAVLKSKLDAGGIMDALKYLNSRIEHRFTAIYKFQGSTQRAVFLYDRLNQPGLRLNAIAMSESLSRFITETEPFGVTNSATDSFLLENGHRSVVTSFYGVALSPIDTQPTGSLCHFDLKPQKLPSPMERDFLSRAKRLLFIRLNGFGN
jgi:hypothetical protein